MRYIFDGPGAKPWFSWYVDDKQYRPGDELEPNLLENAEFSKQAALDSIPGLQAELAAVAEKEAAAVLDDVALYELSVERLRIQSLLERARFAIERCDYLREVVVEGEDSLVRRAILRPVPEEGPQGDSLGSRIDVPGGARMSTRPKTKRPSKGEISGGE